METTLEESGIASLANQASNYLMLGHIPKRIGSLHPNIAPYGEIIQTKDQKNIVLAIGSDKQFFLFTDLLKIDKKLLVNFKTNQLRVKNRNRLTQMIQKQTNQILAKELIKDCHELKIPIGEIKDLKEVFKSKIAKNMILEEEKGSEKTKRVSSIAFRIST